jgi:voltage-gated potassium channel
VNETPSSRGDDATTNAQRQRIAGVGRKVREAPRPNLVERRMSKFLREPPSIRMAASVIVTATALVVVGGGVLIRVLDHSEYPNIWVGMWWATQTVTTVGYGDVTPKHVSGRIVGVFVMLEGISFLAIITAVITSSFVARAANERSLAEGADDAALEARLDARFDDVSVRFDRIESILREQEK